MALTGTQLLRIWERGCSRHDSERALAILSELEAANEIENLNQLPVSARDARLLSLRESTFGSNFQALLSCPYCGERIEFNFSADDLRRHETGAKLTQPPELRTGELVLQLRLPTSDDLVAAQRCDNVQDARRLIAQRCVSAASYKGASIAPEGLPESVIADIARHLEVADPQADPTIEIACPSCNRQAEQVFDIGDFLWREIEAQAMRLLREIHALARGYGWNESEILALTPVRRQVYLELLQG